MNTSVIKTSVRTLGHILSVGLLVAVAACGGEQGDEPVASMSSALTGFKSWHYDSSTTGCQAGGQATHCCVGNEVMVGARLDQNVFKCALSANPLGATYVDGLPGGERNQRQSMHACRAGTVMVGYNQGSDLLICRQISNAGGFEVVDTSTQDTFPMHVCAPADLGPPNTNSGSKFIGGTVMTGINAAQNRFLCTN